MWGWQGPLSPSLLYGLHMQLLAAFPTLPCRQSSKPCTKSPFLEEQTIWFSFRQWLPRRLAARLQAPTLVCACSIKCQWELQPFTCRLPFHPDPPPVLTPTMPRHERRNHTLMTLPVKSNFIYSCTFINIILFYLALKAKKINFMLNHKRAGFQLTWIDTPITVWCLFFNIVVCLFVAQVLSIQTLSAPQTFWPLLDHQPGNSWVQSANFCSLV